MPDSNFQPIKKRKKHIVDHQPKLLFPPDDKNPAVKSQKEQEKLEKQKSLNIMRHKASGIPVDRPPPPVQLLNLIGIFLAEYGFKSTGRVFSTERECRSKIDGWKDETGGKLEKGMPTLGKIYKEWCKGWDERRLLDLTNNDMENDAPIKREKISKRKQVIKQQKMVADDPTSSSASESSDNEDNDIEMKDTPPIKKAVVKKSKSSSRSSSDSDADDENEIPVSKATASNPDVNVLKRKASPSGSSSISSFPSYSNNEARETKKVKTIQQSSSSASESTSDDSKMINSTSVAKDGHSSGESSISDSDNDSVPSNSVTKKRNLPCSSDSSSSESDSDSSSNKGTREKPIASSDTSATLSDGLRKAPPGYSESNALFSTSSDANLKTKGTSNSTIQKSLQSVPSTNATKPFQKKTNEPFSRVPKDVKVDKKLVSNAYVPYDYAQKAHEDLIITRGKGFKKEKDRKKRGSYRGGYIDIEGKKGIKFDN
jgi:hypothetical protein